MLIRLFAFALLLGAAYSAQAGTVMCSDFTNVGTSTDPKWVVDGYNPAHYAKIQSASTLGIDGNCTIKNFPAPTGLPITNINFQFWGNATYYIVFDNVYYTGNMSCNDPTQATFWIYWAPGGYNNISPKCQAFMVPVDAVVKKNPSAQTTATIGVPFTYTITAPLLGQLDSAGIFQYLKNADDYDIKNVVITDDLTKTGAALSYVTNTAYLVNPSTNTRTPLNSGLPLVLGASSTWLSGHPGVLSDSTKHLVFSYENNPALALIPAGYNIEIDLTVVLDNDAGTNTPGAQFTNSVDMWFDKVINSTGMVDLHAWPGKTLPMTIVGPNLVVDKTSTVSNLNVGPAAPFEIDVQNAGSSAAWGTVITDNIPAGMCQYDPRPTLTAKILAADGTTKIADLALGTDYTLAWTGGSTSACQLTLTMLETSAHQIEPNQHLIVNYSAKLDTGTPPGLKLTNVAGATRWFGANSSYAGRHQYDNILTDGTPGNTSDFQDAYTITSATQGYFFLKSVEDLITGVSPADTAYPGDKLRYTLQIQNFTLPPLNNITITDDLGALNAAGAIVPGSLALFSKDLPAGATLTVDPNGGTNGAGFIQITGLNLGSNEQYQIQFDVTLASTLNNGAKVQNQANLTGTDSNNVVWSGGSDDPYLNGPAQLGSAGDKTQVLINTPGALSKTSPIPSTATIGQQFSYTITVPETPINVPLYDVKILDNLPANVSFVSAQLVSSGTYLSGTGTAPLVIQDTTTGIDIPANSQAVIKVTVALKNTTTPNNTSGVSFTNSASYTYNKLNGGGISTQGTGGAGSASMNVIEPHLTATKTVSYASPPSKKNTDPANVNDVLQYVVTVTNDGNATAYDADIIDTLPPNVELVSGSATAKIDNKSVTGFIATPAPYPPLSGAVVWGNANGDETFDIPVGKSLVLTYQVKVLSVDGIPINNTIYAAWTSLDGEVISERTGDNCPNFTLPNNYCSGPVTATPVPTLDPTTIVKSVVSDTWNSGGSTGTDSILRVGDTVDYRLTLTLREGQTQNVVITDTLPAGLAFDSVRSINGDTSAPFSAIAPFTYNNFTAPTVSGNTVTWNFGDITNAIDNNSTNNTFVVEYRARMVKNTLPLPQAASTPLTNNVALSYTGSDPAAARLHGSASIDVRQPIMSTPTKSATGFTSPANVNIATDVVPFHLQSCNNGSAPAYSAKFTDVLASQMNEASVTAPVVTVGTTALTAPTGYTYNYDSASRTMTFVLNTPVDPGQCATIDYTIGFHTDIAPNQTWTNSVTLNEYWSLTTPTTTGQMYGPVSSTPFTMTNPVSVQPLTKSVASPTNGEVTIGQEAVYTITVPSVPVNAALSNVVVTDTLNSVLEYVSATAVDNVGNPVTLTNNTVAPGNVSLTIAQIPASKQVIITLHTRVANNTSANAGDSFTNTASYTYTGIPAGSVTSGTSGALKIVEPLVAVTKSVVPATAPKAGDTLTYTVNLQAQSGVDKSNAYDTGVVDTLSLGLKYVAGTATVGGTAVEPAVSGDGVATPQTLTWSGIDITEGTAVQVVYKVQVLDNVGAGQTLANSVTARWTSLDGSSAYERNGSNTPTYNDYFATAATSLTVGDNTSLTKTRLSDTYNAADANVRVGDLIDYELRLGLQEGTTKGVALTDVLPPGMTYESLVSITPASGSSNFTYSVASQPAAGATGTLTWNLGTVVNAANGSSADDYLVIKYRARVLNNHVLTQTPTTQTLTNNATLNYTIGGAPATPKTASQTINVLQPMLAVTKKAAPAGGDTVIDANEVITYTVDIVNSGAAPAYDAVLTDTLPVGLRKGVPTTTSITLVDTATNTVTATLANLAPTYNATTGVATWNFDTGVADAYTIPAGKTLRVVYQVKADADLGAGLTLINSAVVSLYYSFDNNAVPANGRVDGREVYGPTNTAQTTLTTPVPGVLLKANTQSTAAIGEQFTYRITVPATPVNTALYDVRILDDLSASAADLSFVSVTKVSGSQPWTPVNTGTATNLVIEDTTTGIDIPAGEQVVIAITVVLNDTAKNVSGLKYRNTASYTYNQFNNDSATRHAGGAGATEDMTIVGPSLTLQKGGPSTMRVGVPGTFTLNVQNTGTGTAWNTTLTDILPNVTSPAAGGMCTAAPTNVKATIYDSSNAVVSQLVNGTDFTVSFAGAPACTWTITMKSAAAAIAPNNHLIVTYDASLDPNTASNLSLTNIAGATQYLSADPTAPGASGNVHTYSNTLTNGTPGVLDYQDAHTLTTESPVLTFTKTVTAYDAITGQPVVNAKPGDTLKYTLTIQNISPLNATNFTLTDELDKLNTTAMFVPGSMTVLAIPPGASNTSAATGGAKGTGLVSIGNLNIDAQGGANDKVVIEFQAKLVPVITNGTAVLNQAQIGSPMLPAQLSDDPSLGGASDPTRTVITSAPAFRVLKTSQDITSGTSAVNAGDTLRYTITVQNIGTENAVNVALRDLIPANTSYVANSTKLNGVAVADPGAGVSALQNAMLVHAPAPEDATPGAMRADATPNATSNIATITFDVVVSRNLVNGATVCNQGFVNGSGVGSSAFSEQRSDDPVTSTANDPTCRVIGNVPLVNTQKTVRIAVDNNNNGVVDPGDVLEYTITLTNSAATPATGVILKDDVPVNTTYVAGSTTLNGVAVPDSGGSPLVAGMAVNSPGDGSGTLSPNSIATVAFRVQVNAGVSTGTIISNQGSVATAELLPLLTDADGDPTNGYQPTQVVVGDAQQLSITKSAVVVGGGEALPGSEVEYTVQVTNIGMVPASNVVITDDLSAISAQVAYVANSATMNGSTNGVSYTPNVVTANYGTLAPGSSVVLRFRAKLAGTVTVGTTITNTAQVSWNSPAQTATANAPLQVGAPLGRASLNGQVWLDGNFNKMLDGSEQNLADWAVDVYRDAQLLGTVYTGADGTYHVIDLAPNAGTTSQYELRFRAPGAGSNTVMLGWGDSSFTNGMQRISNIVADSNVNLQNLNLPLTPNGVVYNSITRAPIAGATLTMVQATTKAPLPSSCFDDPAQQGQVTSAVGYYKFDLNFSDDAACPAGADYLIQVTAPASGYSAAPSRIIPPTTPTDSDPAATYLVPMCPADAVAGTDYCEATSFALAPPTAVPARSVGTTYYLRLTLNKGRMPQESQIFNNHIPIDPVLDAAITISKTSSLVNVTRGQLVPYTITINNTFGAALQDLSLIDMFPPGFKYVPGSARFDDKPVEPTLTGRQLNWNNLALATDTRHTVKLLLVVGAGVSEGEYVNRAQVISAITGGNVSGEASATVRVVPDPTFDCTDIIGKVFDDANLNGYQDEGEQGLPGVRIVSARGLVAKTDEFGRYHITCAAVPNEDRGSNFILKLDDRTLPSGYRVTTENPLVQRVTRGKAIKFNFGAAIHRVVRLDIADGVFEEGSTEMRLQWKPRIPMLLDELKKAPSILRLSYLADVEDAGLVKDRLDAVKKEVEALWEQMNCCYRLTIETEIFWRRGGPPDKGSIH